MATGVISWETKRQPQKLEKQFSWLSPYFSKLNTSVPISFNSRDFSDPLILKRMFLLANRH
ncbi:hypothetical protein [Enterococcus mundtii]|uniref:hypothetical protein n=1 Tax=Enterococcus mundtii TaxID=53346 RepID=UPI001E4B44BC